LIFSAPSNKADESQPQYWRSFFSTTSRRETDTAQQVSKLLV